jgi:hypothetical protein
LLAVEEMRAWADRVLSGNQTFENQRIDDVVSVDGTVRIRGGIQGEGTILAARDIRFDTTSGDQVEGGRRRVDRDEGELGILLELDR